MTPILVADSIGKSFGARKILTAASLRAHPGQVILLIGANGAGKSTLLRIAAGDLAPDYGTIFFNGRAYMRAKWAILARAGMYYLPDRALLSPSITVLAHLQAIDRQFQTQAIAEAIELCDISPLLHRRPYEISAGELRRAELATAIIRNPECLLADEPLRHSDPIDRERIVVVLRHLATRGCAVIVTGHEVPELLSLADGVTWCTDGTTYELGPPATAREHWRFRKEYLGFAELET